MLTRLRQKFKQTVNGSELLNDKLEELKAFSRSVKCTRWLTSVCSKLKFEI